MPAIVPKPYKTALAEYHALCATLAETAWREYMQNVNQKLYLTGTKSQGLDTLNPKFWIWASFAIGNESTPAFVVTPEPIPRNLTQEQLAQWIQERLRGEPMYIFAD